MDVIINLRLINIPHYYAKIDIKSVNYLEILYLSIPLVSYWNVSAPLSLNSMIVADNLLCFNWHAYYK